MDTPDAAALILAGLAAGVVNAIAGGGSLITFPTLLVLGAAPVSANVTNSVAVSPGYLASVYGNRAELRAIRHQHSATLMRRLIPAAVVGSAAGCAVLLLTPQSAFLAVVPFLVLAATATLALRDRFASWRARRGARPGHRSSAVVHLVVALAAAYGGYFGAALGVIMVAALGLLLDEELVVVNAVKNVVSATVGLTTVVLFALFASVDWAAVAVIAPASLVGGYLGARLSRQLSATALRAAIVVIGTAVGLTLLITWLP